MSLFFDPPANETLKSIAGVLERPLSAEEIEWRASFTSRKQNGDVWCRLLPYKTSKVDKRRLDEAVGKFNWKCRFYRDSRGALFCEISLKVFGEWISKEDCGEGETSKAEATDAFKRACFQWGIGLCLYDIPQVWVKLKEDEYYIDRSSEVRLTGRFRPEFWHWYIENDFQMIRAYKGDEKRFDLEKMYFNN